MESNGEDGNPQKNARVTSSLGALLTGLSSKKAELLEEQPEATEEAQGMQGFDVENMAELTTWNQLGRINRKTKKAGGSRANDKYSYDDSNPKRNNKRESQGEREGSGGKRGRQDSYNDDVYGPKDITDWNDLKIYEDDNDEQYFRDEEAVLADRYGGNFIKLKYIAEGKIGYYCEICHAEMNAKKSLELHCSGMKHLKKKDIWEKNGRKILPGSGLGVSNNPQPQAQPEGKDYTKPRRKKDEGLAEDQEDDLDKIHRWSQKWQMENTNWRSNRNNYSGREDREGSWSSSRNVPPAPSFRDDDYDRHSFRDRDLGRRGPGGRDLELLKYYSSRDQDREPFGRREGSFERDRDRDTFYELPREREDYFRDSYRDSVSRDGYGDRRDDQFYDRWGGRDRREDDRDDFSRFSPKRDLYPDCRRPPVMPAQEAKLAGGPTGTLLQKLGDCCVKSNDDAELAMSVVSNLSVSLKDFYSIRGEAKVADLLGDVELKLKTIKALKVGLKVLGEASFHLKEEPAAPPVPAPSTVPSVYGNSAGFSANQPVRYPVAGLYRPPVKY